MPCPGGSHRTVAPEDARKCGQFDANVDWRKEARVENRLLARGPEAVGQGLQTANRKQRRGAERDLR